MERKQNMKDSASGAAPKPAPKQSQNEASTSPNKQGGSAGTAPNQGASMNQGAAPKQSTPPNKGASPNQGASGQNGGEQDLLQHAKQAGGKIVDQVQQEAGSQIAKGKDTAVSDLSQVVQAVRRFGESLAGEQSGPIARYAAEYGDKAANSLERFSTYVREQDPKQLLNDVQNFGRRRPAILLGGAFLLGFAGARLIKSSMEAASQHAYDADFKPPQTNVPALKPAPRPATPGVTANKPSTNPNAL